MEHRNFHPAICQLLDELSELRTSAGLRSRDLLRDEITRAKAESSEDAYAYCMMRLRDLEI